MYKATEHTLYRTQSDYDPREQLDLRLFFVDSGQTA